MPTAYGDEVYGKDRMHPCIYGPAAGDAPGVPYGFCARGTSECTGMADGGAHGQPAGTWPDDTPTALCICPSIEQCGRVVATGIADRFHRRPAAGQGRNRPMYLERIDDD